MVDHFRNQSRREALVAFTTLGLAGSAAALMPGSAGAYQPVNTDLVDSLGVQVHLNQSESAYHRWPNVATCMKFVGLEHMRTAAPQRDTLGYALMEKAAVSGYRLTFTMRHNRDLRLELEDLEEFAKKHPGSIAGIEGPNEIDHRPVIFGNLVDTKAVARAAPVAALAYQSALYDAVKTSPVLRSIPVIAFSDFAQARQRADFSNTHIYPRDGHTLSSVLPRMHSRLDAIDRPIMITEMGFNSLPTAKPFPGTDEATQAILMRDAVESLPTSRVRRMFIYELIDGYPPSDNMDTHFGLFRFDYSAKPAAAVVSELVGRRFRQRLT